MELANRDAVEEKFAGRLAKILTRHSRELTALMGNPPDPANIPDEFWQRLEKEKTEEDALMLFAVLLLSGRQHLDLVFTNDPVFSRLAATNRMASALAALVPQFEQTATAIAGQAGPKFISSSQELLNKAFERGDLQNRQGLREVKNRVFGVDRVEREITTSVTAARAMGGEKAIATTVGLSPHDVWMTVYGSGDIDKRVCPICEGLNGMPRGFWSVQFPLGPPAHDSCRCEIVYRLENASQAVPESVAMSAIRDYGQRLMEDFDDSKHPRDDHGQFVSTGAIAAAKSSPTALAKLSARVSDPQERAKLAKAVGKQLPAQTAKPQASKARIAEQRPSAKTKSELAKASQHYVGAEIQRYAEEHNEKAMAAKLGGKSLDDNEPVDIVIPAEGPRQHGIELKTMVDNRANKITMKRSAMDAKAKWERKNNATIHTVVLDDSKVFNAKGPGKHDESQRRIFYRRGYGSFRVGGMHEVKGGANELKSLMAMPKRSLPAGAK